MAVGRAYLEADRPGEALLYLRAAENSATHRGEVRRLLGLAHLATGDVELAVEELMAATRAYPDDRALAAALDQALERFTEPISLGDLADGVAAEADGREDAGADAGASFSPAEHAARASLPPEALAELETDGALGGAFGLGPADLEQAAACGLDLDLRGRLDDERLDGSLADRAERQRAQDEELGAADGRCDEASATEATRDVAGDVARDVAADAAKDVPEVLAADAAKDVPEVLAAELEEPSATIEPAPVERLPSRGEPPVREVAPRQLTTEPWTVLLRGRQKSGLRSWARRLAIWAGACAAAIALALGVVCASSSPEGSSSGSPDAVEALPATVPAAEATEPVEKESVAFPAARAELRSEPAPRPEPQPEPAPEPSAPEPDGAGRAAAPDRTTTSEPAAPSYGVMSQVGVPAPPGGVLDAANSSMGSLLPETASTRRSEPLVLSFRTPAPVDRVLESYAASGITGFRPRIVAMGGRFQGVQRTVARTAVRVADGRKATITVSNPGVDPAAKQLVPETTVRIEIF